MEIDSSAIESNNLVEFPKILTSSIITFNSNYLYHNNDFTNNLNINNKKSEIKNTSLTKRKEKNQEFILSMAKKISKNKINYMNNKKLFSTINNYNNSNIYDPINKYVNKFIPFIPKKIKKEELSSNFMKLNKEFLYDIEQINLNPKKSVKEKEKLLNFKKGKFKLHNYYLSRTINIEKRKKEKTYEEAIILIQKIIRGFLYRIKINREISRLTVIYIIEKIIKIQNSFRCFLKRKKNNKNLVIKIIKNERKIKANKIIDLFLMYHSRNQYKKYLIINKIIYQRIKSVNKIRKVFKYFLIRKKINEIKNLQKNHLEIIYPINNKKDIKLKIYYNNHNIYKIFQFEFCEIRKLFVLYINKDMIGDNNFTNGYLCHFFVDNQCVIDKRYKIIKNKNGIIYNFIYFPNIKNNNNTFIKKDNHKNQCLIKLEKIEMKTIPYKNKSILVYRPKNNRNNNSINEKEEEIFRNKTLNNNPIKTNLIEDNKEKNKKREFNIKNRINLNNNNKNNIIIYRENFIYEYNNINNNNFLNNYSDRNNLNYNPYFNYKIKNELGNSDSTISNSNTNYNLNSFFTTMPKSKKYKLINEKENQISVKLNKNVQRKKKICPIFY